MQFANVDGLRVAYRRSGSGPVLILLHGFIVDGRVWDRQIQGLSSDFDVIAWDAPGTGQSSDPPEDFTMSQFADVLAGLLDGVGVTSANVLGLSWGGTLALELYRRRPDLVRSLVLADTYAGWAGSLGEDAAAQRLKRCIAESESPPEAWIPQWAPEACSKGAPREIVEEHAAIMADFHPVGFRAMSRALAGDFSDILPTIRVPTLLIWGDGDTRSPVSVGVKMRAAIPGARLAMISNAGHVSNMEQPSDFNAKVRDFCLSPQIQGA